MLIRLSVPLVSAVVIGTAVPLLSSAPAYACSEDPSSGQPLFCNPQIPGSRGGGGGGSGGGGGPTGPGLAPDFGAGGGQVTPGNPVRQHVPTITVAQSARDGVGLPVPRIHTSPEGKTFVKVRTGLWIEPGAFEPRTASASVPPDGPPVQTLTATATPKDVTWKLVESSVVCDGPGAKRETACGYTYQRSSLNQPSGKYRISATITWTVAWRCEGQECDTAGGNLPPLTQTSTFDLTVGEIQTGSNSN